MSRRKEPKIQIRFGNFNELDKIELQANQEGEKLGSWARKRLIVQAAKERAQKIIFKTASFSAIEMLFILREIAGPEISKSAQEQAQNYINGVFHDETD